MIFVSEASKLAREHCQGSVGQYCSALAVEAVDDIHISLVGLCGGNGSFDARKHGRGGGDKEQLSVQGVVQPVGSGKCEGRGSGDEEKVHMLWIVYADQRLYHFSDGTKRGQERHYQKKRSIRIQQKHSVVLRLIER